MSGTKRRSRAGDGKQDLEEIKEVIEKRLFVGRVPSGTEQSVIEKVFSEFGPLTECKTVPGRGVAFVGFETWGAAHKALSSTDGQTSLPTHGPGQTLVVSFAERTKGGRGRGAHFAKGVDNSRVFVGGLPDDVGDGAVSSLFKPYGHIESIKLLPPKSQRRCGFVTFSLWGEALDAIEALDASVYPGSSRDSEPLTVVIAEPRDGAGGGEGPPSWTSNNNKRRRVENDNDEWAPRDRDVKEVRESPGPSKQEEFEHLKEEYLAALDSGGPSDECTELHWSLIALRELVVPGLRSNAAGSRDASSRSFFRARLAPPVGSPPIRMTQRLPMDGRDAARLFIGGLPLECSDDELRVLVEQVDFRLPAAQCELLECRVLPHRGCGYVRFSSWAAATEAIEALDERQVEGWPQMLRARWATPKTSSGGGAVGERGGGGGRFGSTQHGHEIGADNMGGRASRRSASRDVSKHRERKVQSSRPELDRHRLFIAQLQRFIDTEDIRKAFDRFGSIEECRVLGDKCVAYVTFSHEADAKKALRAMDGVSVPGVSRNEGLNVQFAKCR